MPKIIKKFGKKTFILGLILLIVLGIIFRIPKAKSAALTKESDTLSDSRQNTV